MGADAAPIVEPLALALQSGLSALPSLSGGSGAVIVFVLTVAGGGLVLVRGGRRFDRGVAAVLERPLSAVGHGLAAYVIAGLLTWYGFSQLSLLPVDTRFLLLAQFVVLAAVLAAFGGFGFAVVGAAFAHATGLGDPWLGLVGLSGGVALVWSLLPVAAAMALWLCVAAAGIGGPTRRWLHSGAPGETRRG